MFMKEARMKVEAASREEAMKIAREIMKKNKHTLELLSH